MLWPHRQRSERLEDRIGRQIQPVTAQNRGDQNHHFHLCERIADTDPRPGAERKVGVIRQAFFEAVRPAFWFERLRVREVRRIAVRDPLRQDHALMGGNHKLANRAIGYRRATDRPGGRVQTQDFFADQIRVR